MTNETVIRNVQLQTAYLDALEDLIKAHDAEEACRKFLRTVTCMVNCPSAFIALADNGAADSLSIVACVGEEFGDVNTQRMVTGAAISTKWQNFSANFECAYTLATESPSHSFSGYPIYKMVEAPYGFLALPGGFPVSAEFRDVILPSLVSLLAHRLYEFDLLSEINPLVPSERIKNVRELGVRFPKKEDFFDKSRHDVNGLLTVASLQAQMLSGAEVPQGSREQWVDRLLNSIRKVGVLVNDQEHSMTVLLSSSPVVSFQKCIDLSLKTFNIGMRNSPKVTVEWRCDDQHIAVRGSVMHWIFHNFLRQLSTVAQLSDVDDEDGILMEVNRSGTDIAPVVDLGISVQLSAYGLEAVISHLHAARSGQISDRYTTPIFDHLFGLAEILGWAIHSETVTENFKFSLSIPCVPPKT